MYRDNAAGSYCTKHFRIGFLIIKIHCHIYKIIDKRYFCFVIALIIAWLSLCEHNCVNNGHLKKWAGLNKVSLLFRYNKRRIHLYWDS